MSIITNKIQTSVTAAQAIAMNWGPELTEPRVIVDTPAALVSLLDQLRPLAAAGKIATIDLAGNGPLEVSYKSYSANAAVLALVAPGYAMTLSGVPVARAVAVQADNKVAGYTIADTASAIAGALDMLTNLTRLTAITLTAGATLSVPYSRVLTSGGPLSRIVSPYNLTVTRVTTANLAQARTIPHASAVLVVDTAAAVLAAMSVLNADTMVGGIALSGGTGIAMTYAQYGASLSAVARLANGVALTVSGVPASAAAALQANARVTGFSISDTAANVTQVLETLNNASRLTEIAVADGGTIKLTFNRFLATGTAIARLAGNGVVTVNGVTADGAQAVQTNMKTGSFSVTDSAANVSARLDALNAAGKISSITLSDTNPLRITAAQLTNNSFALGRLPASWKAVVTQATVAAAGTLQSNTHVPLFSIRDSAANIVAGLDTLNAAGKLSEIALTGTEPLVMTAARYATATGVLLKITGSWSVSLTAAGASSVMDSHVVSYSITDTAANVLAALTALNSVSRLTAINLSDAVTLPLTMTQFTNGSAALGKLAARVSLTISGVTAAAAASMQANSRITTFTVLDTAASIAAGLEKLNTLGKIAGIAIRDGVPLTITAAQFNANAAALGKLPLSAAISVSAAAASAVTGLQANARIASFSVSDTAANIAANIAALNAASRLQLITLTDSAPLSVTYGQLANAAAVLAKLPLDYGLTISGVAAQSAASVQITAHVRSFTVNDTVSNVTVYLDQLTTCGKLTTINLTDSKPLALIYAQYSNDTTAMSKITGTWSATVSGVAASAAARVQADSHVSTFTVNDTAASVSASFDGLNGISKLTSITLSNTASLTMTSAQLANNTIALSKLAPGYHLTIQNAKVSDLPSIHANSHVTAIQLIDTAANIIGGLATLNADQLITSVTLTGGNALALTYAQFAAGGTALGKLAATNVVTVSGVSAANAQQVQGNARVTSFTVTDSAAGIAANIESLAGDGKLTAITMTGAASLTLTYPGFLLGTAALNRLTGTWSASLTDVNAAAAATIAADAHVSRFTVSDTLANIGNRLDQLEAAAKAGKLTSINVTDSGGSLTLSPEQYAAGADAIALMHGGFTINHAVAASNAKINLIWAASTQAAPAAFRTAVTYAAEYFQTLITNPITINLAVGYGEVGGSALPGHALGAAGPDNGLGLTYGQFRTYLGTQAYSQTSQNIVANLPVFDPSNGATVYLAAAQAKAMGLMASSNTAVDGSMGFATDPDGSLFAYDPANRAVAGKYDFIGVVEHEISHALGRIAFGGGYGSWISTLDLFRFTAPGVNSPNAISGAYFSIDNGTTNLNPFAASSDLGDWAAGAGMDANVAYSRPGVINQFSATDIVELNALGFATTGTPSASRVNVAPGGAAGGLNAPSLTLTGSPTLAFMTDDVPILNVSLHPAQGIEQVALFSFGEHLLKIDLDGVDPSAFLAFDTSIAGHHAIALADRNDPTHGIVLMDMPANNTAADLMAHHLTFRDGMAIVG